MIALEEVVVENVLRSVRRVKELGIVVSIVKKGTQSSRFLASSFIKLTASDISYSDWHEHKKICKLKLE
jgi:hypothetical protein